MSDDKTYNQVDSATALKVRKQPQPGDVLDSIYRLDQPLGKGGVGIVYKAWHLHLQRPCAIKFLHPQLVSNAELRIRFHAGETLFTESSYKYTAQEIAELAATAGFRCTEQWIDSEWPFAESVCIAC